MKIELISTHHKFSITEQSEEYYIRLDGGKAMKVDITEIARVRAWCSRAMDRYRSRKREREKHSKQQELNLDR